MNRGERVLYLQLTADGTGGRAFDNSGKVIPFDSGDGVTMDADRPATDVNGTMTFFGAQYLDASGNPIGFTWDISKRGVIPSVHDAAQLKANPSYWSSLPQFAYTTATSAPVVAAPASAPATSTAVATVAPSSASSGSSGHTVAPQSYTVSADMMPLLPALDAPPTGWDAQYGQVASNADATVQSTATAVGTSKMMMYVLLGIGAWFFFGNRHGSHS